jgi:hypothetical protein
MPAQATQQCIGQLFLKLVDLPDQRWLAVEAALGRSAEVAGFSYR